MKEHYYLHTIVETSGMYRDEPTYMIVNQSGELLFKTPCQVTVYQQLIKIIGVNIVTETCPVGLNELNPNQRQKVVDLLSTDLNKKIEARPFPTF